MTIDNEGQNKSSKPFCHQSTLEAEARLDAELADALDDDAFDNVDQEGEVARNHSQDPLSLSGCHHRHRPHLHHTMSDHAKEGTGAAHIAVGNFGDSKSGDEAGKRMGGTMCIIIIVGSIFNFINSNAATIALSYACSVVAILIAWAIFGRRFFASSYNLNPRAERYVKFVLICLCLMVGVEILIDILRLSASVEGSIALAVSNVFNVAAAIFSALFTWDRDEHNYHHDSPTPSWIGPSASATPSGQTGTHCANSRHRQKAGDRNADDIESGDHDVHRDTNGDSHHGSLCPHIDHHLAGMMYYFIGGVYYVGGLGYIMFKYMKEKEDKEE
jgi:hypothetical protein